MPSRRKPPIGMRLGRSAILPIALGVALGAAVASDPPRSFGERIGPLRPGPGRLVGIPYAPEGAPLSKAQRVALIAEIQRLSPQGRADEDPDRRTPEFLRQRAVLALVQKNPDGAIQLLERALENLPASPTPPQEAILRSDLSAAHLQRFVQGDSPISSLAALDEAARAVELASNLPPARKNLSEILHRLGLAQLVPSDGTPPPIRATKLRAVDLTDAIRHGDLAALGEFQVPPALAEGVRQFRDGLALRQAQKPAGHAFAEASRQFAAVGSPLARWAEFRLAETEYQAGDYRPALDRLAVLAASSDPLLAGRSLWVTGTIHTHQGGFRPRPLSTSERTSTWWWRKRRSWLRPRST